MLYGSSHSRGRRGQRKVLSEVNMTSMVDVMCVLLVIFMVATPMMNSGLSVDLPETSSTLTNKTDEKPPIQISIQADGSVSIGSAEDNSGIVPLENLSARLQAIYAVTPDAVVQIRGDRRATYESMAVVLDTLRNNGFEKIDLVTDPAALPAETPRRRSRQN